MPADSSKSSRYIFSLEQVYNASLDLPPAEGWPSDTYEIETRAGKKDRVIVFRRIKYKNRDGVKYRWIYDGKLLAET